MYTTCRLTARVFREAACSLGSAATGNVCKIVYHHLHTTFIPPSSSPEVCQASQQGHFASMPPGSCIRMLEKPTCQSKLRCISSVRRNQIHSKAMSRAHVGQKGHCSSQKYHDPWVNRQVRSSGAKNLGASQLRNQKSGDTCLVRFVVPRLLFSTAIPPTSVFSPC